MLAENASARRHRPVPIPRITVHLQSHAAKVGGHVGDFTSTLTGQRHGRQRSRHTPCAGRCGRHTACACYDPGEVQHGVVVVATGATEQKPQTLRLRQETRAWSRNWNCPTGWAGASSRLPAQATVVMIQCVEQRDDERPYCSRVCCTTAVKNALAS